MDQGGGCGRFRIYILNAEPILFADGLEVEYEKGGKDENKVLVWQDRIASKKDGEDCMLYGKWISVKYVFGKL